MDVLSPFISVLCHSDWLFHGESCPRLDVVHPGHVWPSSPACTWHCSQHFLFLQATPLFPHCVTERLQRTKTKKQSNWQKSHITTKHRSFNHNNYITVAGIFTTFQVKRLTISRSSLKTRISSDFSHSRIERSCEPDTTKFPLGLTARQLTKSWWPCSERRVSVQN